MDSASCRWPGSGRSPSGGQGAKLADSSPALPVETGDLTKNLVMTVRLGETEKSFPVSLPAVGSFVINLSLDLLEESKLAESEPSEEGGRHLNIRVVTL